MCLYDVQVGTGEVRSQHQATSSVFFPSYFVVAGVGWGGGLELTALARLDTREPQGPSCLYSVPSVYKGARVQPQILMLMWQAFYQLNFPGPV